MLFAAILVLLLSPKGDLAFGGSIAFAIGTGIAVICAALIKFAVLPGLDTFPAFCLALGLYFIPIGCGVALAHRPAVSAVFTAMAVNFMPLLSPTNQMNYNTVQFYNAALAIVAGCSVAPLAFRLLPLPSSEVRARRFLALTLRDMRRLAVASQLPRLQDWEGLVYGRLAADCSRRYRLAPRLFTSATSFRGSELLPTSMPRSKTSREGAVHLRWRDCDSLIAASRPVRTPGWSPPLGFGRGVAF
jgi:uncharacterized membrane protein YccC